MKSPQSSEQVDVVVVGAGLAGLAAAATAAGAGAERSVLVLDGTPQGGRAATDEVGRFRFNRGAHALYNGGPARQVLDRLGVPVRGVQPPLKGAQGRLRDQVGLLPSGAVSLVRSPLIDGRAKVVLGRLLGGLRRWRPASLADRTATQWFDDLGLEGDARSVVEMLARLTTYAADLDLVSADLVARQIQLGVGDGVEYLHGGWISLVAGLRSVAERRGARLELGTSVRRIEPAGDRVRVVLRRGSSADGADGEDERVVVARWVVLAAGTPEAVAGLLPERPAAWTGLGPPSRAACFDLGLARVPDTAVLLGIDRPFYMIRHAPPAELAPPGAALVHTLWYLRSSEDPSPAEAKAALGDHCRLAGIDPDEAEEQHYLHRMVACGAIPVPDRGGMAGRPAVTDTGLGHVVVAGDWVGPEGHLADASLASGEQAAQRALAGLDHAPRTHPVGSATR
jgi:2-polyprenyl-6-methoxyphenol hydroxylase-like FAD-dependent oxidoreductase